MKIQKVMNTPGPASGVSNSLEQNMKEDKYESVRNENTLLKKNFISISIEQFMIEST
jgi:hypothetical protein